MSQINRPPIGLQSLLGSKNFGSNPNELSGAVLPMVDLFPFWGSQVLKFGKDEQTGSGTAIAAELEIPSGKTWAVITAGFSASTPQANEDNILQISLEETDGSGVQYLVAAYNNVGNVDADLPVSLSWKPPVLFWLNPGTVIRGQCVNDAAAQVRDVVLDCVYYELDV